VPIRWRSSDADGAFAIVRDAMDFSTALCDASGQNLAQGLTTPMHLAASTRNAHLIGQYHGRIAKGDVFIGNDPYLASGQHLPDIYVIRPVFHGERLCGWAATIATTSMSEVSSLEAILWRQWRSIRKGCDYVLKLVERDVVNTTLMDIISANVRVPDKVLGDIHAQMSACLAGDRELSALLERYGADRVADYGDALQDYSERLARSAIALIPDGTYRFSDHIDGLGEDPQPIEFHVAVTVRGDELKVDWTGTSPQ